MKTIKNHFKVSLNEVVLALVSSAIRSYLLEYAKLPEESLRTNIPVSIRSEVDDQLSNKVTTTTVTLATDLDDPLARLQAITSMAFTLGFSLGMLWAGLAIDRFGLTALVGGAAVLGLLSVVVVIAKK